MSSVKINFSDLEDAIKDCNTTAASLRSYATELENDNFGKLENITGGNNGEVYCAYINIKCKKNELENRATRLEDLASSLSDLETNARDMDKKVKEIIEHKADRAQKKLGIECSAIENFWVNIKNGVKSAFNQTAFGQAISNALRNVGDWLNEKWEDFRIWYAFNGGQMWVNIGLAVLAIAAAVFTIVTAGTGFLAIVAIVGAVCAIVGACVKIGSNIAALVNLNNGDPAWAYRLKDNGSLLDLAKDLKNTNSGPEWLQNTLMVTGYVINTVETVCAIINLVDFATSAVGKFAGKETMFQKYLGKNGLVDHALHDFSDVEGMKFSTELHKWVGADGKVVDISKFSWKTSISKLSLKGNANATTLKTLFKADRLASKANWQITKWAATEVLGFKGTVSFMAEEGLAGVKRYFTDKDTGKIKVFKTLTSEFSLGISGFKSNSDSLKLVLDNNSLSNGFKKVSKIAFTFTQINNGINVAMNSTQLATGNLDDLSKGMGKLRKVTKKFNINIGKSNNWYGNINALAH